MSYRRPVRREWCVYCRTRHDADRWYATLGGGAYCHYAYRLAEQMDLAEAPIAFLWLQDHIHDIDSAGSRIIALRYRPDIRGLCDIWAMTTATPGWRGYATFVCGFALQLYWPQTMLIWAVELLRHPYANVTRTLLVHILRMVRRRLSGLRIVNGVLCASSRGLDPMTNPSERRSGTVRYLSLASQVDAWASVARRLQDYMAGAERGCAHMLGILRDGNLLCYRGICDYGNVRLLRALLCAAGGSVPDTMEWWDHLCRMSRRLRQVTQQNALTYDVVLLLRDRLRLHLSHESYSLLDLSCFLCLLHA